MARIDDIPGISGANLDLLRAAGVAESENLLSISSDELMGRLDEANRRASIVSQLPAMASLDAWRSAAASMGGQGEDVRRPVVLPTGEMRRGAAPRPLPTATPMSAGQLRDAGIAAAAVPIGTLLPEDGTVVMPEQAEQGERLRGGTGTNGGERAVEPDLPSRLPSEEAGPRASVRRVNLATGQVQERGVPRPVEDAINLAALGKSQPPAQRVEKRNHGMLHRSPSSVILGAMATVLAMILTWGGILASLAAVGYALITGEKVPAQILWVLAVFPVALILYVTLALRARCRLCGQRLFQPKGCGKHVKAHRSPFGPIFAVAMHALTCGWFRCMLCGTKQRLKE